MKNSIKIISFLLVLGLGLGLLFRLGAFENLSLQNIPALRSRFLALGVWAFAGYFALYVVGCLFSLPGLPLTVLGGALFGPLGGTLATVASASAGLGLAFLFARYAFRDVLLKKFGSSEAFRRIDEGVKAQGWRLLMVTRLVPVFPFSLQNYLYGLTNIGFWPYWLLSTLFIIPGTAAYTLSAGAILEGNFSTKNLLYLGLGALCFIVLSFLPRFLGKKVV